MRGKKERGKLVYNGGNFRSLLSCGGFAVIVLLLFILFLLVSLLLLSLLSLSLFVFLLFVYLCVSVAVCCLLFVVCRLTRVADRFSFFVYCLSLGV